MIPFNRLKLVFWGCSLGLGYLFLGGGCALQQREAIDLQPHVNKAVLQLSQLTNQVYELESRLKSLEKRQVQVPDHMRRLADLEARLKDLEGEVRNQAMREQENVSLWERFDHKFNDLHTKWEDERKESQTFRDEIQKRIEALSSGRNRETSNLIKEGERSGEGAASVQPGRSPEEDAYEDAYQTFRQGNWLAAREKFQTFLVLYPTSNLADNAQFWIGECFYSQNEYERAIVEYEKVIQDYAQGDKVSSALLKQAFAFEALGQIKESRILLEQVIRKFPQSEQTQIARKKLESMGKGGGTRP